MMRSKKNQKISFILKNSVFQKSKIESSKIINDIVSN